MKKISLCVCFIILLAPSLIQAKGDQINNGFSVGVGMGGFPFNSEQHAFLFSVDIGYGFTDRLAIRADIAYAQSGNTIQSEVIQGNSHSGEYDKSVMPLCLSLLYATSIQNVISAEIGIGAGYYSIQLKEDMTSSNPFTGTTSRSNTYKLDALAPHFQVGIKTSLTPQIVFYGVVRHMLIKTKLERMEPYYYSTEDYFMGGVSVRVGVRFHISNGVS